ncbi:MAG: hypothetical protein JXA38_07480, partial [Methanosarcinaceae archaeon]|nr:hypothetical protein [Methanosarcinaceae archaeon]
MGVSHSNTMIEKAERIAVDLLWNKYHLVTGYKTTNAEPINEKLTNKQLKDRWNNIDWKVVET